MQPTKSERLRQARQHIADGRVSLALSIYQSVVDEDPSDLAVISMLGDLYVKAGRVTDAAEHLLRIAELLLRSGSAIGGSYILKKVLKIDPANPVALMNLGELHVRDNKIDSAHDAFIEAGAGFWHAGNKAAAVRMNQRALEIVPSSRHAKAALALIQREIDEPESTEVKVEPACDLPEIIISIPDGSDAVFVPVTSLPGDSASLCEAPPAREDVITESIAKAESLVRSGDVDQAVVLLREALLEKPDHIQLREKLKDIYLRAEMTDRAIEECVNIAAIYRAQGDGSRAADYVTRARFLRSSMGQVVPLTQTSGESKAIQETGGDWGCERLRPAAVM